MANSTTSYSDSKEDSDFDISELETDKSDESHSENNENYKKCTRKRKEPVRLGINLTDYNNFMEKLQNTEKEKSIESVQPIPIEKNHSSDILQNICKKIEKIEEKLVKLTTLAEKLVDFDVQKVDFDVLAHHPAMISLKLKSIYH